MGPIKIIYIALDRPEYVDCHKSIRYANYGSYAPLYTKRPTDLADTGQKMSIVCNLAEFAAFREKYKYYPF